jgi:hypothetical protein
MGFDSEKFPARGVFFVPVKDGLPYCGMLKKQQFLIEKK